MTLVITDRSEPRKRIEIPCPFNRADVDHDYLVYFADTIRCLYDKHMEGFVSYDYICPPTETDPPKESLNQENL